MPLIKYGYRRYLCNRCGKVIAEKLKHCEDCTMARKQEAKQRAAERKKVDQQQLLNHFTAAVAKSKCPQSADIVADVVAKIGIEQITEAIAGQFNEAAGYSKDGEPIPGEETPRPLKKYLFDWSRLMMTWLQTETKLAQTDTPLSEEEVQAALLDTAVDAFRENAKFRRQTLHAMLDDIPEFGAELKQILLERHRVKRTIPISDAG